MEYTEVEDFAPLSFNEDNINIPQVKPMSPAIFPSVGIEPIVQAVDPYAELFSSFNCGEQRNFNTRPYYANDLSIKTEMNEIVDEDKVRRTKGKAVKKEAHVEYCVNDKNTEREYGYPNFDTSNYYFFGDNYVSIDSRSAIEGSGDVMMVDPKLGISYGAIDVQCYQYDKKYEPVSNLDDRKFDSSSNLDDRKLNEPITLMNNTGINRYYGNRYVNIYYENTPNYMNSYNYPCGVMSNDTHYYSYMQQAPMNFYQYHHIDTNTQVLPQSTVNNASDTQNSKKRVRKTSQTKKKTQKPKITINDNLYTSNADNYVIPQSATTNDLSDNNQNLFTEIKNQSTLSDSKTNLQSNIPQNNTIQYQTDDIPIKNVSEVFYNDAKKSNRRKLDVLAAIILHQRNCTYFQSEYFYPDLTEYPNVAEYIKKKPNYQLYLPKTIYINQTKEMTELYNELSNKGLQKKTKCKDFNSLSRYINKYKVGRCKSQILQLSEFFLTYLYVYCILEDKE